MQREEIIRTAAQIFREKGYHATSMRDIAEAVQLQKASLYHHIESKQDLLLAILDQALDILIEDLEPIIGTDQPAAEKLRAAMKKYIERVTTNADLAAVLLLEHRNLEPELRAAHIERRDRFERLWRQIIHQGIKSGEFRQMDEAVAVFALLGVQNWLITWYQDGGRLDADQLAEQFAGLFLDGMAAAA